MGIAAAATWDSNSNMNLLSFETSHSLYWVRYNWRIQRKPPRDRRASSATNLKAMEASRGRVSDNLSSSDYRLLIDQTFATDKLIMTVKAFFNVASIMMN